MSTDYNIRAAKGQAYNLAVADAISKNKTGDVKYIYKRYVAYYNLGQLIQDSNVDMILEIIEDEGFGDAMKKAHK